MSVPMSSPRARFLRRSISSSGTPTPPAASLSRSPRCSCQTFWISGRSACTSSNRENISAVSRMTAFAPESDMFHWTCAGDDVS
ncbi:hypothetical protein LSHI6S_01147 [Leifsonia shinshuensis]